MSFSRLTPLSSPFESPSVRKRTVRELGWIKKYLQRVSNLMYFFSNRQKHRKDVTKWGMNMMG